MSPNIEIRPFNDNLDTLRRAVTERVFYVKSITSPSGFSQPPRPGSGVFEGRLAPALGLLKPHLPTTAPLNYQQFVDTFRGRKRMNYERALDQLRTEHCSVETDAIINVFVKYEKVDHTSKKDPVPRVISPRNPRFNLRLGRYLRPIEERIFKSLGKLFGHKTVMKGTNTEQTAHILREKWEMYSDPVAIGLDASRFDQHVSYDALKFEHSIYEYCYRHDSRSQRKLKRLLRCQLKNRCVGYCADGSLSYAIEGTRMSGDMNTSLGNCVLMCMMIKAYSMYKKVDIQLANNGDDCVVFLERSKLQQFSDGLFEWFMEMGFNMAIEEPVYEFEHIEFCQTQPIWDGNTWTMCRNPITAIAKDSVLMKNDVVVSDSYFRQWLDAVGTGGISLAGSLPVFQSFYQMYQRSAYSDQLHLMRKRKDIDENQILPWYMREVGLGGSRTAGPITPEARCSFWSAFGVTPDEQEQLEMYYDSININLVRGVNWTPRSVELDLRFS